MLERFGNILTQEDADAIVITTNGYVKANGECVMGRGIAKQISTLLPYIPYTLGQLINKYGNKVHLIESGLPALISFPVKPVSVINNGSNIVNHAKHLYSIGRTVAGYHAKADIEIIKQSLIELIQLADSNPHWKTILLPRVGCGAGELDWYVVKPLLESSLDDRFIVMTFK